ncbi:MAG: hypothetical protein WAM88_04100 [Nitrososphaeraceae archaeon]
MKRHSALLTAEIMNLFAYISMTTALASNGGRRIEIYKPCALGAAY